MAFDQWFCFQKYSESNQKQVKSMKIWIRILIEELPIMCQQPRHSMWLCLVNCGSSSRQFIIRLQSHSYVIGGKGAGHNFWKNNIAQGHNTNHINQLESNGTKMADKTRPWSSISKWNDTPRGALTVPRHCQNTKEWEVAQILKISTPSPKELE